ncbi:hypothetical protein ONS95_014390 [Cadophora gregata]|uniref:uncharacterized protein n=1 Tax=Cadophora gregata TaxID=51156 RepID=UPI0026DC3F18|nr:uncharacterized protein ONS95_014390 [Cadophora gregata]KAK0112651.1 hypothetical protein ONS95_014390 [Cadophora gregata]
MGRAYVQFKIEYNIWITLFPDELFPGKDPLTGQFTSLTGREILTRHESQQENASSSSRSRSPSSEPPRRQARTRAMTNVHDNGSRNGNATNGVRPDGNR